MRTRARFLGADGSLGYRKGHIYTLTIRSSDRYPVIICRANGDGYCPYSSWEKFWENWAFVHKEEEA